MKTGHIEHKTPEQGAKPKRSCVRRAKIRDCLGGIPAVKAG